jgi:ubiquinone/menaquinone biosynthesis C-methylase UbiE
VCHLGAGRDSLGIRTALGEGRFISVDVDHGGLWQNANVHRVLADGMFLPFKDQTFDIVIADNVFEHLTSPRAVLEEVARCLKPKGAFVFLCPNKHSYIAWLASLTPHWLHAMIKKATMGVEETDTFPTYYRLNSIKTVCQVADQSGLQVETIRTLVGWPTYWEFSNLLHRIFVVFHKVIELMPSRWHITLVGVLRHRDINRGRYSS